jgi:hypothetical protein
MTVNYCLPIVYPVMRVHQCLRVYISVYTCNPVTTHVTQCLLMYLSVVYACNSVSTHVPQCLSIHTLNPVALCRLRGGLFNLKFSRLAQLSNFYLPPWQNALSLSSSQLMLPHVVFGVNLLAQADTDDPALYQKVRRWLMFVVGLAGNLT